MNDDDLNLCAKVYTWNVNGECILRNVPELGGAPPTTSKSVVSAGTWGARALKQLLEWNGKVTVGDVAVVVTEASLRTAQKLPSEGRDWGGGGGEARHGPRRHDGDRGGQEPTHRGGVLRAHHGEAPWLLTGRLKAGGTVAAVLTSTTPRPPSTAG